MTSGGPSLGAAAKGPASARTPSLRRYAWLSIAAALGTMALKTVAWLLTGSVGLLSDALESIVNLVAAVFALYAIKLVESGVDEEHAHGHDKAEYFSSGLEGLLILGAAAAIALSAVLRLMSPKPLESVGIGMIVSVAASLVNFAVARVLFSAGKKHRSITLRADAHHLMTDVWTSGGILVGVALVHFTGWIVLDPIVALVMAFLIARTGGSLVYESGMGLLDRAASPEERRAIEAVLEGYEKEGISWHALRTRVAGSRRFITVHVLVPGDWSVRRGHDLLERIEHDVRHLRPKTSIITHLEPVEDPRAHDDLELDRQSDPGVFDPSVDPGPGGARP